MMLLPIFINGKKLSKKDKKELEIFFKTMTRICIIILIPLIIYLIYLTYDLIKFIYLH